MVSYRRRNTGVVGRRGSEMTVDTGQAFESFCSRMYLDYSDETSDPYSIRLEKKDYIAKYKDWLKKQFIDRKGIV